jgi:hypothetical protein
MSVMQWKIDSRSFHLVAKGDIYYDLFIFLNES